ncbi:MAG: TlpA family protein disulfide reductase [Rhodospirillales bacterium]|nr:TlpA family protein disulfide reductase [Rhodospirillales bacterium]
MDQNSLSNRLKEYKWPAIIAVAVTLTALVVSAIVVKSPRLASTERLAELETPAPHLLAQALLAPKANEAAFTTPFFNAKAETLTLNTFKGQGVVLNFWATWCAPCVREMPALDNLAAKLKDRGVRVVALSEDRKAMELVPPFYADKTIHNLDIYYDVTSELSRAMSIEGLPTTLLITADGREIGRVQGPLEWDNDAIADYLAQALGPR